MRRMRPQDLLVKVTRFSEAPLLVQRESLLKLSVGASRRIVDHRAHMLVGAAPLTVRDRVTTLAVANERLIEIPRLLSATKLRKGSPIVSLEQMLAANKNAKSVLRRFRGNAPCASYAGEKAEYGQIVVHALAGPTRGRGSRVDVTPLSLMHIVDRIPPVGRPVLAIGLLVRPAVLAQELPAAILASFDDYFALVHHAMVRAAKRYQIGKLCFTAVRPVFDVMCVDVTVECATWKSAAGIARIQRAAQRGWNAAGLTADVEWFAIIVLDQWHEAGVAGYLTRRFHCNRRTVFDLAAAILVITQCCRVDVHHDLIP